MLTFQKLQEAATTLWGSFPAPILKLEGIGLRIIHGNKFVDLDLKRSDLELEIADFSERILVPAFHALKSK